MRRQRSVLGVVLLLLIGCAKADPLVGSWVQPIPGMEDQIQGIKLEKGGRAESINMYTLLYKSWEHKGNQLILQGESVGNGQTINFTVVYVIKQLSLNKLVLQAEGEEEQSFERQ